jgi:hypothetical protein
MSPLASELPCAESDYRDSHSCASEDPIFHAVNLVVESVKATCLLEETTRERKLENPNFKLQGNSNVQTSSDRLA